MGLSFGIYKSKLLFFIGIVVFLSALGYFISKQFISASVNEIYSSANSSDYVVNVEIKNNSAVLINGKTVPNLLKIKAGSSEFRYIVVEEAGLYINHLTVNVTLPKSVDQNQAKQVVYAVHGVEAYDSYQKDSRTLVYEGTNLGPMSTFTVVAELPAGLVKFSWWDKLIFTLSNMNVYLWLAISLSLPILTIILLVILYAYKVSDWRLPKITGIINQPPSDLSPAEIEVLMYGRVSARSIAAILIDLAQRDYLYIIQKNNDFVFGKRRNLDLTDTNMAGGLKSYEKILLSKIFSQSALKSRREDILMRIGRHIFSRKVAEVYYEIYQSISAKGYFIKDPSLMHRKFHYIGVISFFVAVIGFIFGIWVAPDPKFLLIFWGMMVVASLITIKLAPQLPTRSNKGKQELLEWLKFRKFLVSNNPLKFANSNSNIFTKFLPYAITMGVEVEWTKRFANSPFTVPDWYVSVSPMVFVEDFADSLYAIIGFASYSLASAKEPIIQ